MKRRHFLPLGTVVMAAPALPTVTTAASRALPYRPPPALPKTGTLCTAWPDPGRKNTHVVHKVASLAGTWSL